MIGKNSVKNKLIFYERGLESSDSAGFGLARVEGLEYMGEGRVACICVYSRKEELL